ncbi:MAG: PH domain-containing protein [Elusimicrobiota bacterium]
MNLPHGEHVLWRGRSALRARFMEMLLCAALFVLAGALLASGQLVGALACALGALVSFLCAACRRLDVLYLLTEERVQRRRGLLSRQLRETDLREIVRVDMTQTFGQRLLGLGDIAVISRMMEDSPLVFSDIAEPLAVKERIRTARQRRVAHHGHGEEASSPASPGEALVPAPGQGERGDPHRAVDPASAP